MKKLICTRGIPASGKTTWSKQQGGFHITKDELRRQFPDKKEDEIIELERRLVIKEIIKGTELIIVDNTHLGKVNRHIEFYWELAIENGYEFSIEDFYCTVEQAIHRDKLRENSVGADVIRRLASFSSNGGCPKYSPKLIDNKLEKAIIVDIDGTLAFAKNRNIYDFGAVNTDEVNEALKMIIETLGEKYKVIIVSGRDDRCLKHTNEWLKNNLVVNIEKIFMRKAGDKRGDEIVKKEIYNNYIKGIYNIIGVFDDRNKVVDMWRLECNLPTYQVWYGNF